MSTWYARNREKVLLYQKAYYKEHREKYLQYLKDYYVKVLKPIRTIPPELKKRQPAPPKPPKEPKPKKEKVWKDKTIRKTGSDYEMPAIIIRHGDYVVSFN
jgi:hypothetical protein